MRRSKDWWFAAKLGFGLAMFAFLEGCATEGYVGVGDYGYWPGYGYYDYYGPSYYGGIWGPDVFVFGDHRHGRFDHDFGRRGFRSRAAVGGPRGGFRGAGPGRGVGGGSHFGGGGAHVGGGGGRGGGGHR